MTPEKIFRAVQTLLVSLNRGVEVVLRRLSQAQETLTESLKGTLPVAAQSKFLVAQRVAAKLLDLLITGILGSVVPWPLGPIVGFGYSVAGDGLDRMGFSGQSVGNRLMGLKVIRTSTGEPIRYQDALVGNLPVGVATFFAIIPLWGWIICVLVGVPLMLIEIMLMLRLQGETRLGDIMASTRVVECKSK